jgi:hypothetical protein
MYLHTCQKCLHSFRRKDYLTKHLQRKYPCKEANTNNIVEQGKSKVNISTTMGKPKVNISTKMGKHKVNISTNIENVENNENNLKSNEEYNTKKYECEYCNKDYNYKQSKSRHLKKCKKYKNITEKANKFDKIVKNLDKQNKSLILVKNNNEEEEIKIRKNNKIKTNDIILNNTYKHNHNILSLEATEGANENDENDVNSARTIISNNNNNNTNNNTTNNNTINNNTNNNTIIINHINPFGKENLESITEEKIINILNQSFNSFQETIKAIHKDIPENSNFYLPNKSDRKHILYYNGQDNIYETASKFKDKLCDKTIKQIEEWYDKYNKKCIKTKRKMLKKVFNEYYDGKLETRYNTEVDNYLLTYSNAIKKLINNTLE